MTADVAMQTAEVQPGVDGTFGVYTKVAVVFTLIGTFAAVFYAGSRIGKGEWSWSEDILAILFKHTISLIIMILHLLLYFCFIFVEYN